MDGEGFRLTLKVLLLIRPTVNPMDCNLVENRVCFHLKDLLSGLSIFPKTTRRMAEFGT